MAQDITAVFTAISGPLNAALDKVIAKFKVVDSIKAEPEIAPQGVDAVNAALDKIAAKMNALGKMSADPSVELQGADLVMMKAAMMTESLKEFARPYVATARVDGVDVAIMKQAVLGKYLSANFGKAALVGQVGSINTATLMQRAGLTAEQMAALEESGKGKGGLPSTFAYLAGLSAAEGGKGGSSTNFLSTLAALGAAASAGGVGDGKGGGGPGLLATLGMGGGFAGLAGFGSVLSLMGLGAEHIVLTGAGLAGSAVGGAIGGGLLGLGALGSMAVGGGIDMGVSKSSITDISNAVTGINALQAAILQYGAGSAQAAQAQAALNYQMSTVPAVAQAATLATANAFVNLQNALSNATGPAENIFMQIAQGAIAVATQYVPMIGAAATRNFTIIKTGLTPLTAFFAGPFKAVFQEMENVFAGHLPAAMQGLTDLVEILSATIAQTAPMTGGLLNSVVKFLDAWNSPSGLKKWHKDVSSLVTLFHEWLDLIIQLGKDIYYAFKPGVGLGSAIVVTLTQMLKALGDWEKSSAGSKQLHLIFSVHKTEVLDLLKLLGQLVAVGGLIYLYLIPPFVTFSNVLLTVVGALVSAPIVGTIITWVAALLLFANTLKVIAIGKWILGLPAMVSGALSSAFHGTINLLNKIPGVNLPGGSVASAAAGDQMTAAAGTMQVAADTMMAAAEAMGTAAGTFDAGAVANGGGSLVGGEVAGAAVASRLGGLGARLVRYLGLIPALLLTPEAAIVGFAALVGALSYLTITTKHQTKAAEDFGAAMKTAGANAGAAWSRFGPVTLPGGPHAPHPGGLHISTHVTGGNGNPAAPPGYHYVGTYLNGMLQYLELVKNAFVVLSPAALAVAKGFNMNYPAVLKSSVAAQDAVATVQKLGGTAEQAAYIVGSMPPVFKQFGGNLHTAADGLTSIGPGSVKAMQDLNSSVNTWAANALKNLGNYAWSAATGLKELVYSVPQATLTLAHLHGRALGGPVTSGNPYVVGENGPEWFVPGTSGTIIPNGGGAGLVFAPQITIQGNADPSTVAAIRQALMQSYGLLAQHVSRGF